MNKALNKIIWQTKKLGEVCEVFEDGDWIEKKDQSLNGIRLIQTGNVGNGVFKDRMGKARYISEKTFKRLRCTEILPGDCLVSRLPDPVGRSCIIPNTRDKMITAVDCTIIRFQKKVISPEWFINFSLSQKYQDQINKEVGGATRQRISRKNLNQIEIPLPPLSEQHRIVKILDEVFEKIAKSKENAKKNLQNAKELFESYLQGVFANPRKDWEEKRLEDICESMFAGGDVPKNNFSKFPTSKYSVPIYANGIKNKGLFGYTNKVRVSKPSITVSARGTIGYSEIRRESFFPVVRLIVLIPDPNVISLLCLYYLTSNFKFLNTGTSIPQLTIPMIENLKFYIPPLSEQKSIVAKLDALSAETKKLEAIYKQKLADLEELKKSVLKKAFSGEL